MVKEGRVVAFALLGTLLLLASNIEQERTLDLIVLFRGASGAQDVGDTGALVLERFTIIDGAHVFASGRQSERIRGLPSVEGVYPNRILHPMLSESVPLIGASIAQAQGFTGSGIRIAVVDTGVNASADTRINTRVINQSDCTQSSCQNNNPAVDQDNSGHGTQMAVIAAGSGSPAGVATAASIIDVKVAQAAGSAVESDVVKGIDYALNPDGQEATKDGADIILLSFGVDIGGSFCAGPASQAIDNAVSRGVAVVVANGDNGCVNGTMYPACSRKAIAVGSTTDAAGTTQRDCPNSCGGGKSSSDVDSWFCWSSRGVDKWEGKIKPDLVAPGYAIDIGSPQYGTTDSAYSIAHSSSIAAAHVAGAAAILMQKIKADWGGLKDPNPDVSGVNSSTAALKAILLNSANELGASGRDVKYGAGRLNVTEALREANSSYVRYCNRWGDSGDVSPSVKTFYHNISVPQGANNLSITLYWEEDNRTTHKKLDLALKNPGFSTVSQDTTSPASDVAKQVRIGSPSNGTWYAVVTNTDEKKLKYVLASNYPLGDCQPPALTSVQITTYNGTLYQRDDFYPSNHYDWLEEYNYGTQVVQYRIEMRNQYGELFYYAPGTSISISYHNGVSDTSFVPREPTTSPGIFSSWDATNYEIPLPNDAAATYVDAEWPHHEWYIEASVSNCGYGCPQSAPRKYFYVNKTYAGQLNVTAPAMTRWDTPAAFAVNVSNLGNVGDKYTIRWSDNFTPNTAGIGTGGRCTFNIVTNPVGADYKGTGSTNIEVTPASTLTGGDYCWMEMVNSTSEHALFLVRNTTTENGTIRKAANPGAPLCDGLPLNYSGGYKYVYFTHTLKGPVYVKETDFAIRAYPDTANWSKDDGKLAFKLWYAKDDNGDFVPNTGESYQLAFTRTKGALEAADSLSQIEVNSSVENAAAGPLWQLYQSAMGVKRFLLQGGQRYSFKLEALDADLFQLGTSIPSGESASGGCTDNVTDNNSVAPSDCLCIARTGMTVFARFFGHDARYGYSEVRNVGVYINDMIQFLTDNNYSSQVCEGDLNPQSVCYPHASNKVFYRNVTKFYFQSSPKSHNLPNYIVDTSNFVKGATVAISLYDGGNSSMGSYSIPCTALPCTSTSTISLPQGKVGIWSANFSASAPYFTPAGQVVTFPVRGRTNISITNPAGRYYRGVNYTFNSTVRNEFGNVEDSAYYGVVWELHNGTGSKTINSSRDFRYAFTEEVGLMNVSANASGTYLDASTSRAGAELWDRLNSSITIFPDPDYQLGSYLNFSINVTRAFREAVASGIEVRCNLTSANLGNGTYTNATFSDGLWRCRQQLNKETTFIGSAQIRANYSGSYYEPNASALAFTILGANLSAAATAPSYAYMGTNFAFSINITNRGNWNSSKAHFSLLLPAELVRASGNWSERDVNDTEALGHNLQAGESFSYSWAINATSQLGNYTVNLSITADNAPTVLVVSPLEIRSTMDFSVQNLSFANATMPVNITANITNVGNFNITNANVSAVLPADLQLTGGNRSYLFGLQVGERKSLSWEVLTDLGANFTVLFNVTSDNAGAFVRNTTLSFSSSLYVRVLSPNGSARANATDYEGFTAMLNITHNRTVIGDLYKNNFSAQIGDYAANITSATFQGGLWNLTITTPQELSESLNYDLRVRVLYYNQSINRTYNVSSVSYGAVHSKETVPALVSLSLPPSFSAGNQSRINVSVYDKSELSYLSGTFYDMDGGAREYNFSKVSSSGYYKNYTYLFTPAVEGAINLTITAMDWYGTSSTNKTNFSVYGPPRIRNIFFPNSRYLAEGENVTFLVNATSHVGQITVVVNITNATSTLAYGTVSTPLGYNFTHNFTALGTYLVNAVVNDSYGNRVNYSDFFAVSNQVSLLGNFSLNGVVSLNPAGTADPRISITPPPGGTFAVSIPAGTYDIYARTSDGNLTVKLSSVSIPATMTGKAIAISTAGIASSVFASNTAYEVSTNFTYPSILLGFRYPQGYNASRVYIYKCSYPTWNNSQCNGSWTRLATTADGNATTAYSTVTGLSAFSVGQERLLSNRITAISPATGVTAGSAVAIAFNVSLDGNPQTTGINPRVWFDSVELNVSGYAASGYQHQLSVTAPALTSLKRNVILEARYQAAGTADYLSATDTWLEGVTYYVPPACGDGICNGNETCGSCSSDCSCGGTGGTTGGGYTVPLLSNMTTPQPALLILEYPASVSVAAGNSTTKKVSVKNVGNIPLNVSVKFDELTLWVASPGSKSIALNSSAEFEIMYSIPEYAQAGTYPLLLKAVANNFYNTTLATKSSQLTITPPPAAPAAANGTPANATRFTPPTAEERYAELRESYQKARNDLKKIGLFGYNVSALERELAKVGPMLDGAYANITSPDASEKMDLAAAKLDNVKEDAKGLVSARYSSLSKEKPEYADVLSQAEDALNSGDFGRAAYLLNSIETKSSIVSAPSGTGIVYSILLIAALLAIGGAGYYNKEEIKLRIEDLSQKSVRLQVEDVYSKSKALLGKRVSIKGTVLASGAREGGFWIKMKDRTGEILVWSRNDMSLGELIEVRGIVSYDRSIDTWYVEARMLKGAGA